MQNDFYQGHGDTLVTPPKFLWSITPHDTNLIRMATRGIMVTEAGDVRVETVEGDVDTLPKLQPGYPYPIRVRKILATGTTATGIKGLA